MFPIVTFILLTVGSISYMFYRSKTNMPVDPNRIVINEKGEEEIIFNPLEKRYLGTWFIAYEGETPFDMKPKKWEKYRYWKIKKDGKAVYHRPDGREISWYWQVSESDSVFRLAGGSEEVPDTVRYKVYYFGEKGFFGL